MHCCEENMTSRQFCSIQNECSNAMQQIKNNYSSGCKKKSILILIVNDQIMDETFTCILQPASTHSQTTVPSTAWPTIMVLVSSRSHLITLFGCLSLLPKHILSFHIISITISCQCLCFN